MARCVRRRRIRLRVRIRKGTNEGTSGIGLNRLRFAGGTACYLAQVIGSLLLVAGYIGGLYAAAVAMVTFSCS